MREHPSLNLVLLLILSFFWAGTFLLVKVADASLPPMTLMAGRAISSSLLLCILVPLLKKPLHKHAFIFKTQLSCFISGVLIAYMWFTIAVSETVLSASMTSLLLTSLAVFAWLIVTFITREKSFYSINLLGIIIAIFGVITILGYNNILHTNHQFDYALLYISGIGAFAIAAAVNRHLCKGIDPFITTTYSLVYVAIIMTIAVFIFETPLQQTYTLSASLSVLSVGFISTAIGYLIFFWLVMHAGQIFASLNGYLVPVFGFAMGVLILNENATWHQIIGLLIVFVGTYLTQKGPTSN